MNKNWMTISELCEELGIARSTFDKWKSEGNTPPMVQLPNREYRIRRSEFDAWMEALVAA